MAKTKTKRDARTKRNALKPKKGSKRGSSRKHSPALIPEPEKLKPLLTLVNLLPADFDHMYKMDIVSWRDGVPSIEGRAAEFLERDISDDLRVNTPANLYRKLLRLLSGLPMKLQAFVLFDRLGEVFENDPGTAWYPPYLATGHNFGLLQLSKSRLQTIVADSKSRIERAMELESQLSISRIDAFHSEKVMIGDRRYLVWAADMLVSRARGRLLFVFAARETLSALLKPDAWIRILGLNDSPLSVGALARLYIAQRGEEAGKLAVHPPLLYELLEGIEAARIRECLICRKIFWAGRKDKSCCSDKCADAERARKYRVKYKRQYAWQRVARRQKKSREKGEDES